MADVDYGTDVACAAGFTSSMPQISGIAGIAHVAARGLQTPNGLLWDDWGEDLRQFAHSKVAADVVAMKARRQILKDERVRACKVDGVRNATDPRILELTVWIVPEDEDPFTLTLTITAAELTLVALRAG